MIERVDHVANALDELLLSEFSKSEVIQSLLVSWIDPIQEVEDTLLDFMDGSGISSASGVMLEIIGEWLGVYRENRTDDEFRTAILARSLIEGADGTTEKVREGLTVLCQTQEVRLYEYYPRAYYAHVGDGYNNATIRELRRITAAGVHTRLVVDQGFNSMQLSEVLSVDNTLITGDLEEYEVEVGGETFILATSKSSGEVSGGDGDNLSELFDTEFTPLADVVDSYFQNLNSNFKLADGSQLVDNLGNTFIVRELVD